MLSLCTFNEVFSSFSPQTRTSTQESNSDSDKNEKDNVNDISDRSQGTLTSANKERPMPLVKEVENHLNAGTIVKDAGNTDLHGSTNSNKGKVYYLDTSRRANENNKSSAPGELLTVVNWDIYWCFLSMNKN